MDTFEDIQNRLSSLLDEEEEGYSEASLLEMTAKELEELCKELGLPVYGTKAEKAERILSHVETTAEESPEVDLDLGQSTVVFEEEKEREEPADEPGRAIKV